MKMTPDADVPKNVESEHLHWSFYMGHSMLRTFCPGDRIGFSVNPPAEFHLGDVIAFEAGTDDTKKHRVVHRIIRILPDGRYQTMGDNNIIPDVELLRKNDILALALVCENRRGKCSAVLNGKRGLLHFYRCRIQKRITDVAKKSLLPLFNSRIYRGLQISNVTVRNKNAETEFIYWHHCRIAKRVNGRVIFRTKFLKLLFRVETEKN